MMEVKITRIGKMVRTDFGRKNGIRFTQITKEDDPNPEWISVVDKNFKLVMLDGNGTQFIG